MADIKGASARQLYNMTYRLVAQRATITTAVDGTRQGTILGGTWTKDDKSLNFTVDNLGHSVSIPFDAIMWIRLDV